VPGGYVFQAPSPWVFGSARRYLVDEGQKAEIVAIFTPRRPILRLAAMTIGLLLWIATVGTLMSAFGFHPETITDVLILTVLIVVPLFLMLHIAVRLKLRRLQSVLDGLPRTDERITYRDRRQAMASAMSFTQLLLLGSCMALVCLFDILVVVTRNGPSFMLLFALGFGVSAGHYCDLAIRKARQKRNTI